MPRSLSDEEISAFRNALCAAAIKLFAEKGFHGVTMREIAAQIGVSAMTPYRYFRDKEEILAMVRARAFDMFADMLGGAYDGPGTVAERSRRQRDAYIRFAREHPDHYRLMFDLSQPGENNYPDLKRAQDRARSRQSSHMRDLVAAGLLEGDPELMGYVFWSTLHGVISLEMAGKLTPEYSLETILDAATQAQVIGFGPKG